MSMAMDTIWLIFMGLIDITILYRFVTEIAGQLFGDEARGRRFGYRSNDERRERYQDLTLCDGVDRFAMLVMGLGIVVVIMMLVMKMS